MRYKNTDAVPIKEEGATKMPNELKPKRVGNYHHNGNPRHGLYREHKDLFNLWQTMNELKPEDVMRALECCIRRECMPCPNKERRTCITECMECLMQDALALLREKNAEIERLRTELKGETDGKSDL